LTDVVPIVDCFFASDFIEAIADDYRPGIIRLGGDRFALSVSLPIVGLVRRVSPRVLMAWDRRLLARTQHLTLVISGLQGAYPILKHDGTYLNEVLHRGVSLSFKVGLTQRYKPSKEHAAELVRTFGLVVPVDEGNVDTIMTEDELFHQAFDVFGDPVFEEDPVEEEEEEDVDPGRFERFSLSASLESLLENRFMRVVQLRIKFNLGWAGAEVLLAELERSQKPVEEILPGLKMSLRLADKKELALAESYTLPFDPLRERDEGLPLNLPHLAFAYLLRRLMVCFLMLLVFNSFMLF
jgi:ubiquitin-conjugating enzyme E2 Q